MAAARRVLVVEMGSPPKDMTEVFGAQGQWFRHALSGENIELSICSPSSGEQLPAAEDFDLAILTGSWSMVTDREEWSERTRQWIVDMFQQKKQLFGVCYGHQLMADALGGVVDYHPNGREIGRKAVTLLAAARKDPVLANFPDVFYANLSHEQTVVAPPPGAVVLAHSDHDPHQIIRYADHAISVQFHPEFTTALMKACIVRRSEALKQSGVDVEALVKDLTPTEDSNRLMREIIAASRYDYA